MGKTSTRIGRFLGYLVGLAGLAAIASAYIPDVFGAALSSPTAAPLVVCNTTCSGAGIKPRQTYTVVKPSQTSRTSTTTVTDDPHLSITSLPAGVYAIEATIKTSNYTASGAGFRMLLAGGADPSCTASNTQSASYTPLGLSAGGVEGTIAAASYTVFGSTQWTISCVGVRYSAVSFGVAVRWAQATSSANPAGIEAYSSLSVTRLQ